MEQQPPSFINAHIGKTKGLRKNSGHFTDTISCRKKTGLKSGKLCQRAKKNDKWSANKVLRRVKCHFLKTRQKVLSVLLTKG